MDGYNKGQLRLYIDGELHGKTDSSVIPANGVIYSGIDIFTYAPIVVGAADNAPAGVVNGGLIYYNGLVDPAPPQPELNTYYKGWVDEIRIWDGARTQAQINEAMKKTFLMADVPENPNLLYHYNFCNLPDPRIDQIVPEGFAALNGRPNDDSYPGIPWWRHAADRSKVYDNYLYTLIENTVAHVP